jgi:hypothetical protein
MDYTAAKLTVYDDPRRDEICTSAFATDAAGMGFE